jgi:uncharacterized membrane protein HdeD (DUF308 family)
MLDTLARYWWTVALRGTVAILFGLLALIWPTITALVLVLLFGAYVLVDGVLALGSAIFGGRAAGAGLDGRSRAWLVVEGIAGIGFGIITFIWPQATTLVLLWLIAAWAIVTGVIEIVAAVRLRREIRGEWLLALAGVLSVGFGLLLAIWPAAGALTLIVLIGAYAIVFGAVLIGLAMRLRRMRPDAARIDGIRPATA